MAAVPATFTVTTVQAATLFAAGEAVAGGIVSAQTAALTQGALKMLFVAKLKVAAAIVVATTVVTGGGVAVVQQVAQGEPKVARQAVSAPEKKPVDAVSARRMKKLKDNLDTFRFDLGYVIRKGDKEVQHVYLHVEDLPDVTLGRKSFQQLRITRDDAARIVDGLAEQGVLRSCEETGAFGLIDIGAPTPGGVLRVHLNKQEGYYVSIDGRKNNHAMLATLRDVLDGDAARAMDQVYRLARTAAANRSKPVRVGDISFEAVCPANLPVLRGDQKHNFTISLRITNHGKTDRWFGDKGPTFTIKDAAGKVVRTEFLPMDAGLIPMICLVRVAPGRSSTMDMRAGLNASPRGDGMVLSVHGVTGGWITSTTLAPGTYTLSLTYKNDRRTIRQNVTAATETPLWTGKVTTAPVKFTIGPGGGAKEEVLKFRRLEVREPDMLYSSKADFLVCRDQEEMKRLPWFWAEEIRLTENEKERLRTRWITSLKIDFEKEMVVAAFKGKSPPQDYRIQKVAVRNQTVRIDIQYKKALLEDDKPSITYPYDLVACQRRDLPVVFYQNGKKVAEVPFEAAIDAALGRSKPVRVGDASFEMLCPTVWSAVRGGDPYKFKLGLRITNHGKEDRWFTNQPLKLTIKNADGKVVSGTSLIDRILGVGVVPVASGGSSTLEMPATFTAPSGRDIFGLSIDEPTGAHTSYGLAPGVYTLSLTYKNVRNPVGRSFAEWLKAKQGLDISGDTPLWVGEVTTEPLSIRVAERKEKTAAVFVHGKVQK